MAYGFDWDKIRKYYNDNIVPEKANEYLKGVTDYENSYNEWLKSRTPVDNGPATTYDDYNTMNNNAATSLPYSRTELDDWDRRREEAYNNANKDYYSAYIKSRGQQDSSDEWYENSKKNTANARNYIDQFRTNDKNAFIPTAARSEEMERELDKIGNDQYAEFVQAQNKYNIYDNADLGDLEYDIYALDAQIADAKKNDHSGIMGGMGMNSSKVNELQAKRDELQKLHDDVKGYREYQYKMQNDDSFRKQMEAMQQQKKDFDDWYNSQNGFTQAASTVGEAFKNWAWQTSDAIYGVGDAAVNVLKNLENFLFGTRDATGRDSIFTEFMNKVAYKPYSDLSSKAHAEAQREQMFNQYYTEQTKQKLGEEFGGLVSLAVNVLPEIVSNYALAAASGGSSLAVTAANSVGKKSAQQIVAQTVKNLARDPNFYYSFIREGGAAYNDAKNAGADEMSAVISMLSTGIPNALIEIGGGIETLPSKVDDGFFKTLLDSAKDEGLEEIKQGIVSQLVAKFEYAPEMKLFATKDEDGIINPDRMLQEFLGGAIGGAMGGAVQGGLNLRTKNYEKAAKEQLAGYVKDNFDGLAKSITPDTEAYKLYQELAEKRNNGQSITIDEYKKLWDECVANDTEDLDVLFKNMLSNVYQVNDADTIAPLLTKSMLGYDLTEQEISTLANNDFIKSVLPYGPANLLNEGDFTKASDSFKTIAQNLYNSSARYNQELNTLRKAKIVDEQIKITQRVNEAAKKIGLLERENNSELQGTASNVVTYNGAESKVTSYKNENGNILAVLDDGSSVPVADVTFNDEITQALVDTAEYNNYDTDTANDYIFGYDGRSTIGAYTNSFNGFVNAGKSEVGYDFAKGLTGQGGYETFINPDIAMRAYNSGFKSVQDSRQKYSAESVQRFKAQKNASEAKLQVETDAATREQKAFAKKIVSKTGYTVRIINEDNEKYYGRLNSTDTEIVINLANNQNFFATAVHEITHFIKINAPAEYDALRKHLIEWLIKKGKLENTLGDVAERYLDSDAQIDSIQDLSEEAVAKMSEAIINDDRFIEQIFEEGDFAEFLADNGERTLLQKIVDTVKSVIDAFKAYLKELPRNSKIAGQLAQDIEALNKTTDLWMAALEKASERRRTTVAESETVEEETDSGLTAEELTQNNSGEKNINTPSAGIPEANVATEVAMHIRNSYATVNDKNEKTGSNYNGTPKVWVASQEDEKNLKGVVGEDGKPLVVAGEVVRMTGRDVLRYTLLKNGFIKSFYEKNKYVDMLDRTAQWFKDHENVYKYISLADLNNASISIQFTKPLDKRKKPKIVSGNMSAMVKNGDYAVNFDFSTICKRRGAFTKLLNELIAIAEKESKATGKEIVINLTQENLRKMNEALSEDGFETACLGCFVESKRYNIKAWSEEFVKRWNSVLDNLLAEEAQQKLIKEGKIKADEYFNYGYNPKDRQQLDKQVKDLAPEEVEKLDNTFTALAKKYKADKGKKTLNNEQNIEQYLRASIAEKQYQNLKKMRVSDLITAKGIERIKQNARLTGILSGHYGTATPKMIQDFTPYNNEIALLENSYKKKPAADYLYSIAGVRANSFSDFQIELTLDYVQLFLDAAARKFPLHAYSKEYWFAKMFGKTGAKINMSVMFNIMDESYWQKHYNDLDEDVKKEFNITDAKTAAAKLAGMYINDEGKLDFLVADRDLVDALKEKDKKTFKNLFVQSVNFKEALAIQDSEGYDGNVGIIGVGYSDANILRMLSDSRFKYIIPYHKSSLPAVLAAISNLYNDYTNVQNTMYVQQLIPESDDAKALIRKLFGKDDLIFADDAEVARARQTEEEAEKEDADKKAKKANKAAKAALEKRAKVEMNKLLSYFLDQAKGDVHQAMGLFSEFAKGCKIKTSKCSEDAHGQHAGFDIYGALDKNDKDAPKTATRKYINYCIDNGFLPMFYAFASHENYYKMNFDFTMYNSKGEYVPQGPVTAEFGGDEFFTQLEENMESQNSDNKRFSESTGRITAGLRDTTNVLETQTDMDIDTDYVKAADGYTIKVGSKKQNIPADPAKACQMMIEYASQYGITEQQLKDDGLLPDITGKKVTFPKDDHGFTIPLSVLFNENSRAQRAANKANLPSIFSLPENISDYRNEIKNISDSDLSNEYEKFRGNGYKYSERLDAVIDEKADRLGYRGYIPYRALHKEEFKSIVDFKYKSLDELFSIGGVNYHDIIEDAKKISDYTNKELEQMQKSYAADDNNAYWLYDVKNYYKVCKMMQLERANQYNFFNNSIGFWDIKKYTPKGKPDYKSIDRRTGKVSSSYWYTDKGVYRRSDHWGADVASCSWFLNGKDNYRNEGLSFYDTNVVAFIAWEDLAAKSDIYEHYKDKGSYYTSDESGLFIKDATVRYSLPEKAESEYKGLKQQDEGISDLVKNLERELSITKDVKVDRAAVEKVARKMHSEYHVDIPINEMADTLQDVFNISKTTSADNAMQYMYFVAQQFINKSTVYANQKKEDFAPALKRLRNMTFTLSPKQVNEIEYLYGSFNEFRKKYFGNFRVQRGENSDVDAQYMELRNSYGLEGELAEDISDVEMLPAIAEFVVSTRPVATNVYEETLEESTMYLAKQMYDEYMNTPEVQTLVDKGLNKLNEAITDSKAKIADMKLRGKNSYLSRLDTLKQRNEQQIQNILNELNELNGNEGEFKKLQRLEKIKDKVMATAAENEGRAKGLIEGANNQAFSEEKLINEYKTRLHKRLEELRSKNQDELLKQKARYTGKIKQQADRIAAIQLRKSIENYSEKLRKMLVENTDKNHIPESLKPVVSDFLQILDFEATSRRKVDYSATIEALKKAISEIDYDNLSAEQANALKARYEAKLNEILAKDEKQNKVSQRALRMRARAEQLELAMRRYVASEDGSEDVDLLESLDPDFVPRLTEWVGGIEDTQEINNLNVEQLGELDFLLKILYKGVSTANKLIANAKYEVIAEVGDNTNETLAPKKKHTENAILDKLDQVVNLDMIDSATFFERLGEGSKSIYEAIRQGFNKRVFHIREAQDYMDGVLNDVDVEKWTGKNAETIEFENVMGDKFTLSISQIMELYELAKREQGRQHILKGGITPTDIKRKKGRTIHQQRVLITEADLENIIGTLTKPQRDVADAMQKFLEKNCASWGDEVTMQMYGYKKFGEKNYYPIHSDNSYTKTDDSSNSLQTASLYRLKNLGMTKSLVKNASNPVFIDDIFNTFVNHVVDMANYNAYVAPLADAMKWYNYKGSGNVQEQTPVKQSIKRVYGAGAQKYFVKFIENMNGVSNMEGAGIQDELLSRWKATSVAANIRVAIQQPTAILRALAILNPQYLGKGLAMTTGKFKQTIAEAEKNSAIAQWKGWGYFDTGIGHSMMSTITGIQTLQEKISDKSMILAEYGDKITWAVIWNACKAQISGTTDLKEDSAEYMQAVTKLFDEVVDKTQVVDTPLHRSQIMRNKNPLVQMEMAFMAEPTKTYNMIRTAIANLVNSKGSKESIGAAARSVTAVMSASLFTALASALADVFRDTDKSEEWWEKYIENVVTNFVGNINPLTFFPITKDIVSKWEGFDVERQDLTAILGITEMVQKLVDGDLDLNINTAYKFSRFASMFTGIPIYSVLREVDSLIESVFGDPVFRKDTTDTGRALANMYKAMVSGDDDKYNRMYAILYNAGKDNEKIETSLRTALSNPDSEIYEPRVYEAALARYDRDTDRYLELLDELAAETGLGTSFWVKSINTSYNKIIDVGKKKSELIQSGISEETLDGLSDEQIDDLYKSMQENVFDPESFGQGDAGSVFNTSELTQAIKDLDYSGFRTYAEDYLVSHDSLPKASITKALKPIVIEAYKSDRKKYAEYVNFLVDYCGYTHKTIAGWLND